MAYTSVIPVRRLDRAVKYVMNKEKTTAVSLQDALDYAANRDKTEQSCFESSYACTLETAFADTQNMPDKVAWKTLQSDLFANLPQIKAERMPQDFSAVLPKLWRKRQAWDTERTKRPPYRGEER